MANQSESIGCLVQLVTWMGGYCWMGASSDLESIPPIACENEHATTSSATLSSCVDSKNLIIEKKIENVEGTSVEDEIEQSKVHWSQLTEHINDNEEVAEVSNVEVFKSLQKHPTWGHFFLTFGDGGIHDYGKLVVGVKFAEGGQAELYHAKVTWNNPKLTSQDQRYGVMYVFKVFRKETFLRDLQKQWPEGMFRQYEDIVERSKLGKPQQIKCTCQILCGTLLPNGRFAFLFVREEEDLRTLIDHNMKARTSPNLGPFPMDRAFEIMYEVARGMDWLYNLNIVHRDLKASNVLCACFNKNSDTEFYEFYVADYECSIGVVGTSFFRALEILQAIKDRAMNERPSVFTKASDVYSYGMMCYEILTGKLPFQGHPTYDFDLVLSGQQLEVPHHVDEWVQDLLQSCWQFNPSARPTFGEILRLLQANSNACEQLKRDIDEEEALPLEERRNMFPKYEFES